ncbi:MAG: alpha-L-fucosidase [Chthoniobacteraceae bacterium]
MQAQSSVRGPLPSEDQPTYRFQPFTPERWDASSFAPAGAIDWWRDVRFGIFIHLGVSSLMGAELSWSRETRLPPDTGTGSIPDAVYDNLYKKLKLENFDAKEWVRIAQDAGAKYMVVVTKHHDGFHMWDTAFSDYKITKSPFGRDYIKEVVDACHEGGMPIGLYFAQREWYNPQYDPDGKLPNRDHKKYIEYEFNAVRELLTKYGKIDILWFDAAWWGGMFKEQDWDSERLYRMARQLQPLILINNRASIPGDFDTPEQHVGSFQNNRPWESCITLTTSWSYSPSSPVKSLKEVLTLLVETITGDGNLLLDVGPRADGTIEPSEVERLHEIGEWMRKYGSTLYGTRGGPYRNGDWGGTTHKGNKIWFHVLKWTGDTVGFDPLPYTIKDAKLLTGGDVKYQSTQDGLTFKVAQPDQNAIDTIIELTVDRDVPETQICGASKAVAVSKGDSQ